MYEYFPSTPLPMWSPQAGWPTLVPPVDILETKTEYIFLFDIPGADSKDIELEARDKSLLVTAKLEPRRPKEEFAYHLQERPQGRVYRAIPLPFIVNKENITAFYWNGVLEVRIPKQDADTRKEKITVRNLEAGEHPHG